MTVRQRSARVRAAVPRSPVRSAVTGVVLAGSAAAWVALLGLTLLGQTLLGPGAHGEHLASPGHRALMIIAMMWPLAVPTLDAVVRSGFRRWRVPLAVLCLSVLTVLWFAAGSAVAGIASVLGVPPVWWQLGWLAVAIIAGRSARRFRLLSRCTQLPTLAPGGRQGVASAVRAGALTWRRCAVLCGPTMAAMLVAADPVLMVAGSAAAWWEAWHPRAWRDPVPGLLLGLAAGWLVVGQVVA